MMHLRNLKSLVAVACWALYAAPLAAQPDDKKLVPEQDAAEKAEEPKDKAEGTDEEETDDEQGKDRKKGKAAPTDDEEADDEAEAEEADEPVDAKAVKEPAAKAEPEEKEAAEPKPPKAAEAGCGNASIGDKDGFWLGLCGFVALNAMHDSTQSFKLGVHNNMIARLGTYAGDHDQMQFTARDSRITLEMGAPEQGGIRASGMLQFDFNGFMSADVTENDFYVLGPMRMRHALMRFKTPVVDVLAGQYHDLFAWGGSGFYPATLAFLGVPGQIYHRQPQVRLSKTLGGESAEFEIAAAATRPVHKASGVPDFQGGLRLALNGWTGASTQGYGQPSISPLALGVSGVMRRFEVPEFLERPMDPNVTTGWGFAANATIPVIPAKSNDDRSNALTLTAEFSTGTGISDLYTELTGGALFPTLPNDVGRIVNPPMFPANIDSGIVTYDGNNELHTVDWRGFVAGLQYYLPIARGRVWMSGVYSQLKSDNIVLVTPSPNRGLVYQVSEYIDVSLFVALTEAVQMGVGFQTVSQTFGDGVVARNNRWEFGSHFFF